MLDGIDTPDPNTLLVDTFSGSVITVSDITLQAGLFGIAAGESLTR